MNKTENGAQPESDKNHQAEMPVMHTNPEQEDARPESMTLDPETKPPPRSSAHQDAASRAAAGSIMQVVTSVREGSACTWKAPDA